MLKTDQNRMWNQFAKNNWEKKPVHFKKMNSSITQIDESQVFQMLVQYADLCRKRKSSDGFKLYVEGELQHPEDVLQILPLKKDLNFLGYNARIEKLLPNYCLVCDELLQVSNNNIKLLKDFTENLYSHVGFPYRFAEIGLYLGNYKTTPFGVHVDGCGVFSFPVVGKKTFRLWSSVFGKKHPELDRSHHYSKLKKYSKVMNAVPGDMTYWPSTEWHIAESDGSFNVTWSLGVWVDRTHQESLEQALQPLYTSTLGKAGQTKTSLFEKNNSNGEVIQLPKEYLQSIQNIKKLTAKQIEDAMMIEWLKLSSLQGLKKSPLNLSKNKISLNTRLQLKSTEKILWSQLKATSKTIFAFQGQILELKPSAGFCKMIQLLNQGQHCLAKDFLKSNQSKIEMNALQCLADWGAFI